MILGVDRSHLNDPVPLAGLVDKGIKFIFFKATQGDSFTDPAFNPSWQEAKATAGLYRGAYHFYDPRIDGVVQAKNYLSRGVNFSAPRCLPPWVDVEDLVGPNDAVTAQLNQWVADNWQLCLQRLNSFLSYIKTSTGRDCGIYSYNGYMKEYFHATAFPNNPFWLSSIQDTCPVRYDTGNEPEFWQYSYNWNGTDMDANWFTGTQAQLDALANIVAA